MNIAEGGLLRLVNRYQSQVNKDGGVPRTSEIFRQSLINYGLGGAIHSYLKICNTAAQGRTQFLYENVHLPDKLSTVQSKKVIHKILTLLTISIFGPIESLITLTGNSLVKLNHAAGPLDWKYDEYEDDWPDAMFDWSRKPRPVHEEPVEPYTPYSLNNPHI